MKVVRISELNPRISSVSLLSTSTEKITYKFSRFVEDPGPWGPLANFNGKMRVPSGQCPQTKISSNYIRLYTIWRTMATYIHIYIYIYPNIFAFTHESR